LACCSQHSVSQLKSTCSFIAITAPSFTERKQLKIEDMSTVAEALADPVKIKPWYCTILLYCLIWVYAKLNKSNENVALLFIENIGLLS
jgi:hypothetical protein